MNFKQTFAALIPALVLCLPSCQKTDLESTPLNIEDCITATVPAPVCGDPETRGISISSENAAIFAWVKDVDKINVFSSQKGESMIYSVKEVGSKPTQCTFLVENFKLKGGNTYYAFYPSTNSNDPSNVLIDYTTQRQYALDDDSHLPSYSYMLAAPVEAPESGAAGFSFSHKSGWITFNILAKDDFIAEKIVVSTTTADAFITKGTMDVTTGTITPAKTASQIVLYLGEPEEGLELKGGIPTRAFMAFNAAKTLDNVKAVLYGRTEGGASVEKIVKEINEPRAYALGSYYKLTLTEDGAVAKQAKIGEVYYTTLAEAVEAAESGNTVEILTAGTYTVPNLPKNITIKGGVSGVVFNCDGSGSIASVPNGATFEDVAFNFGQNNYHGFQHAGTINMNGCTLNGKFFSYGDMNFNNCIFNQTSADYNMWCYGQDLTYTDCEFNSKGKFLNVYNEGNGDWKITATGCTFNSDTKNKAAFNIKASSGAVNLGWDIVIKNCSVNDEAMFPAAEGDASSALFVGSPIWQVDDRTASSIEANIITVTVDDVLVYPIIPTVAMIGDVEYKTLADALTAVPTNGTKTTIVLAEDVALEGNAGVTVAAGANVVLDLNGKTLSNMVSENKSSQVIANKGTLTLTNGVLKNDVAEGTNAGEWWGTTQYNYATNVITNTGTLIIDGAEIYETAAGSICYAIDNNSSSADAICTIKSGYVHKDSGSAIRMFCGSTNYENVINLEGGTVEGGYAGIWTQLPGSSGQAKKGTLNITGGTLKGEYAWYDYSYGDVFDAMSYSISGGQISGYIYSYGVDGFVTGGIYSEEPGYVAAGYAVADNTDATTSADYPYTVIEQPAVAKIGTTEYATLADAVTAANAGDVVNILAAGTYTIPALPKNITIKGGVSGVVFNCEGSGSIASVPNGATFENVAMNFGQSNYHGFQHAGTINMKGCTLNGLFFSYGDMNFDGCIFNQDSQEYMMWAYGNDLTFTDCEFNGKGKFINVYCESNTVAYNITATGCTFKSDTKNKAAFNVKETCGANMLKYNVVIDDCTVGTPDFFPAAADYDASSALYVIDPLVQVDDRNASKESNITVTLNNKVVYPAAKPIDFTATEVTLSTAADLVAFEKYVNSGNTMIGQTVKIGADIDLQGIDWKPVGNVTSYPGVTFAGTFDGCNHTVSNMTTSDNLANHASAGFFGSIMGTVKNLTLKSVTVTSTHYAGAIVGYTSANNNCVIENCHVIGGTITSTPELIGGSYDNGDKVGGIIGYIVGGVTVKSCSVKDVTITAYRDLGGIVGCADGATAGVTGNTVENSSIIQDNTNGYKTAVDTYGAIIGRTGGSTVPDSNTATNVSLSTK